MSAPLPNSGPYFVGPDHDCSYCHERIRMFGSRMANVSDGEWHTCKAHGIGVGPRYVDGDFAYFDYPPGGP